MSFSRSSEPSLLGSITRVMLVSSSRLTSPSTRDPDAPHRESGAEYSVVSPPASKDASTTVSRPLWSKSDTERVLLWASADMAPARAASVISTPASQVRRNQPGT